MLGETLVDQCDRVLLGEAGKNRFAVRRCSARGNRAPTGRHRHQPLSTGNLCDENRGAAGKHGEIDGFADLLAQGVEMRAQYFGDVGAERSGDAGEPGADADAAPRLGLGDEFFGGERGHYALNGRAGQPDLPGNLARLSPSGGLPARARLSLRVR